MSYELIHQPTKISRTFSRQFWTKALELAGLYGWQPMGTQPPVYFDFYKPAADWHGTYLTNDALCSMRHPRQDAANEVAAEDSGGSSEARKAVS